MYPFWQCAIFVLHDLIAMTCMTAVLSTTRGFRERRRPLTVCMYALSFVLASLNIGFLPKITALTDYDTGILVFGMVSLASILIFPQIILRSARHFSSALICLTVNVSMEGLFSVFGYLFDTIDDNRYRLYETAFCAAGYALTTLFLLYASKNRDLKIIRRTVDLIPKWLYVIIILCSFYSFFSVRGRAPELYNFEKVTAVLRAFSVFGVILFAGYFVVRVFALMAKQNQFLAQMSVQQQNYEKLLQSDEQLRQFRHDYKNHILVVTSLLNAGQTDEAAAYLDSIKGASGLAEKRFLTGNIVVDAILNNKNAAAEQNGITLSFSGIVPEKGADHADLCTVVGNIVDNAIENTKAFPGERYIRVSAAVRNGFLTLSETNPVAEKIPIRNNRIKTTKSDTQNHGIGLKNVAAAAKKHNGTMLLRCSDTEFTIDVTMRLDEPHDKDKEE